jgi:hypothetical protein
MKNWKTTLLGALKAAALTAFGVESDLPPLAKTFVFLTAFFSALSGFFSKDTDSTATPVK